MSETDIIQKNGRRNFSLPGWVWEFGKGLAAVLVALTIGYVRFVRVEDTANENKIRIGATEVVIQSIDRRLSTVEIRREASEREIFSSLNRLESGMKELQADIKALQVKPPK